MRCAHTWNVISKKRKVKGRLLEIHTCLICEADRIQYYPRITQNHKPNKVKQ